MKNIALLLLLIAPAVNAQGFLDDLKPHLNNIPSASFVERATEYNAETGDYSKVIQSPEDALNACEARVNEAVARLSARGYLIIKQTACYNLHGHSSEDLKYFPLTYIGHVDFLAAPYLGDN